MPRWGISLLLKLGVRNVYRNPRRSLLTLLAVAVGICSSSLLAALTRGMSDQFIEDSINKLTGHIQIHEPEYRSDPVVDHRMAPPGGALAEVLSQPPVRQWAARVRVPAVVMSERESAGVTLVGTTLEAEQGLSFIADVPLEGRNLASADEDGIVIGRRLAEHLRTELGRRIVVMSQGSNGGVADRGFRIIGLFDTELESTEKAYVFTGRRTAQKLLGIGGAINEIALRARRREKLADLKERLQRAAPNLDVADWQELEPLVTMMVKVQSGFLYVWYMIVIVTISFGLVNTLFMAIFERSREIGMYQALGMSQGKVVAQILLESMVLLIVGVAVGNTLTAAGVWILRDGIDLAEFAAGTQQFGLSSVVYPALKMPDVFVVNMFAIVIGMASSVYPAWRAGTMSPAAALAK